MANLRVLFALVGFQLCIFSSVMAAKKKYSPWIVAGNFTSAELANLSPQKEHELMLKRFSQKDDQVFLMIASVVELFANGIGNDFFEFVSDEKASIENKAIAKAAFHCFTKLRFQVRINGLIQNLARNASDFVKETGSIGAAYSKLCSKIDENLKNETIYTTFRDNSKKQALPKKTYQYGIPKSEEELRKSFAELANDPLTKKLNAFYIFSFFVRADEVYSKQALLKLMSKYEDVQKIYEESTNEVIPLVKDVTPAEIDMEFPLNLKLGYLRDTLRDKILAKIKLNPSLNEDFEKLRQRIRAEDMRLDF